MPATSLTSRSGRCSVATSRRAGASATRCGPAGACQGRCLAGLLMPRLRSVVVRRRARPARRGPSG
eukprot:1941324-Lingulodinium_polyedra.AAC.1